VEFTADGQVRGSGGVNSFTGSYRVVDGQIEFGALVATLIAGSEPAAELERRLFAVLAGSQPFVIDGDVLTLGTGDQEAVLRMASAPSAPSAQLVVVSGTVTYLERMALPPDAVLVVRVDDASASDEPAPIAEVAITVTNQVPIAYAVAIDRNSLQAGGSYVLSAEITVAGTVWFALTDEHTVYTEPASQTVDVVVSRV
jgi:putative lipoprotein